jgi:type II secretory pathway component GspD/PulD (secretin)/tetratricopeptide (TPR) repeat protein
VFHARKWGWKRLAANLLLIPVLGGWSVGTASAQYNPVPPQAGAMSNSRTVPFNAPAQGGDPKAMLKEGRKALAAGQFDYAQDMARKAEANNPTGKWGLFDDTPRSLLEDIQKAVGKQQKAEAERLTKEAKSLATKPAASEAEKAANLEHAYQLADRAAQLHGPYSAWDLGDRPDKMMKEFQTARAKLKVPAATGSPIASAPGNPAANNQQYGSAFQPTAGMGGTGGMPNAAAVRPTGGASDQRKAAAVQMMTDAKKLADQGQFGAARGKLAEADRLGAAFAPNEYSPGFAIEELNARGTRAIATLVAESKNQMGKKDYEKADAAITAAADIASSLGLFPRGVDETRAQLRTATGGKFGTATAAVVPSGVPAGGPDLFPGGGPISPIGATNPGTRPVVPAGGVSGQTLLAQAKVEFRNGALDTATTLATQAYNQGGPKEKEEAAAILTSIDGEKLAQKQITATRSFEAATAAMKERNFSHALGVLVLIDSKLLPPQMQGQHAQLVAECRTALGKSGTEVATTGGMQPPPMGGGMSPIDAPPGAIPGVTSPGSAVKPGNNGNPDSVATQQDALRRVQVQKFRNDGLKIQADAAAAFGRGETDLAIQMLLDYANRVRASGMEPAAVAMLLRPIDSRLEMFRVMKGQADAQARVSKESRDAKDVIAARGLAEEQRKTDVAARVKKYNELMQAGKYKEAEKEAMVAKQLDPDNPALGALAHVAKMKERVEQAEKLKDAKENLVLQGLNGAEQPGPYVDVGDPVAFNLERMRIAGRRGNGDQFHMKTRTPAEYEIEMKLNKPIPIEMSQVPLDQAIDELRRITDLPISVDTASITAEGINLSTPITERLQRPVATRHVLTIVLEKAGLSYVVENDVVKVTTTKKSKGRLFTKVFSVADLVTPIPNFALPDYANLEKMIQANPLNSGRVVMPGLGNTPFMPHNGLGGGTAAGSQLPGAALSSTDRPGIGSGGLNVGASGQLTSNPLDASAHLAGERNTKHEQLIKLITGMVRPYSWDGMGGPGRIEYFDIGSALVVNQVADVIQEVADLLEALRRLQDLAIAVEIRIVSLSEAWYERIGVDFAMNIKTHNTSFEPALTQVDPNTGLTGVFAPLPFINSNNVQGATIGLTAAGVPTGDLGVPIRPNTFNRAIPAFGGFPNTPGDNGGIAFGLAFLNDIQVSLFMEAAQGDRRINTMQAPKLTMFNGQTATLSVNDVEFFVANVSIININGQVVFIPQNSPFPIGVNITVQAVVSADRRFVRMNLPVNLTATQSTTVPLFPVTTFVTPVFEGGSQGIPIPFTQFLQQPAFTSVNISTTVVCPDGGTVLLGGLKTMSEGRNEFGPPFLSKIPYLNRLFKNVGIGRETRHVMVMVTPRIIINSEEEIFQTEGGRGASGQP